MNAPAKARFMVERGLAPTPFHDRIAPLNRRQSWVGWAGYASADVLDGVELEYFAIRNQCSLYDLSPMHKYRITGPDAERVMNRLVTRDIRKLAPGRVAYAVWCDEDGMVIDDGAVLRFAEADFRLTCQEVQYSWLHDIAWGFEVAIEDESADIAAVSLQGPTSFAVLEAAGFAGVERLRPFDMDWCGSVLISRTGFTGDLGYELWIDAGAAPALWDRLWEAGRQFGIRAIGHAALDMARIEAGHITVGLDFVPSHAALRTTRPRTPFELGLGRLVAFDKPHFNGRRALLGHARSGPRFTFVGLEIDGAKPADDALVYHRRKREAGRIVAAMWSPTLKRNIAIAELVAPFGVTRTDDLWVEIYHRKELKWEVLLERARIVERPFFKPARRSQTPPGRF